MNRASVIIGSGFGDEGKGLATDLAAHRAGPRALVVRFNGGAQAGHTVVTPDGRRHVFSHVGSGSFAGSPTYLSRHFVCHPMVFADELVQLGRLGVMPEIHVDRNCPVTTPFDVMINQALEAARGGQRHGSCGMGFGETLERHQVPAFRLCAGELAHPEVLRARLRHIRDRYLPARLAALKLETLPDELLTDEIVARFVEDCRAFCQRVCFTDHRILRAGFALAFEGAQGLLLDMDRGVFPHVTRSHTGLTNVIGLAAGAGIDALDVTYVSRWYATRHGAGPLGHELAGPPLAGFIDRTNQPNAWQGGLRFALLDTDGLVEAVLQDLREAAPMPIRHQWLLTWADAAPRRFAYVAGGRVQQGSLEQLSMQLGAGTGADAFRLARGEHRGAVSDAIAVTARPSRTAA